MQKKIIELINSDLNDNGRAKLSLTYFSSHFHCSGSTIRRRLQDEGVIFRELIRDYRSSYAFSKLRSTDLSAAEVGFRLGYANASDFYRAFKIWTGMTVNQFRERKELD